MPRPTKLQPERGNARTRLLEAAKDVIRQKGFNATTVDDLCRAAGVTKGAYFHHFESKEALGVAAANYWAETTDYLFANAPYHDHADPLERILAYVDFREAIIEGDLAEFTCLVGTMTQETYASYPSIRDACAGSILGHAATLQSDIAAAIQLYGVKTTWSAKSLAVHIQAVIQGAFIVAKATSDPEQAKSSLNHLRQYIELLFTPNPQPNHGDMR